MVNVKFTFQVLCMAVIGYLVISSWDEVINRSLIKYFDLDEDAISTSVAIAVVATITLLVTVVWTKIEVHDFIGISETADTQLTGLVESIKHGQVIHSKS